ncbi:hypothetical protein PV721_29845 [Streptomyces sp. MB09-01]|uniref:hypothetical protein n=1 Tax=Streptomyces sp. MB09-01 TaxID=3028666 RepID=UPI0029AF24AC|nr:hypothetical protein [Streptomyces sp. MB09-01]MDX3538476.1 hypothetical protein [Streptomyces sp. MB09-01]
MKIKSSVHAAPLTTALIAGTVIPAFAASGSAVSTADQAVAAVQRATGTTDVAGDSTKGTVMATDRGSVIVTTPARAKRRVSVAASDGSAVTLGLPATVDAVGTTSAAGTTVYPHAAAHTDLATQATVGGGARALVTLRDAAAPTTQRFDLGLPEGASLVADGNGGYDIVTSAGGAGLVARGHIDAPWAKDTNGKSVPTRYSLEGDTLIQTIETGADTVFPVVADLHYTWGIVSGTVYFNRNETKVLALGGTLVDGCRTRSRSSGAGPSRGSRGTRSRPTSASSSRSTPRWRPCRPRQPWPEAVSTVAAPATDAEGKQTGSQVIPKRENG